MINKELLKVVVDRLKKKAHLGLYFYGNESASALERHKDFLVVGDVMIVMIFTRDTGMHSGGWFRNPDYERCYHLSLSFRGASGNPMEITTRLEFAPQLHDLAREVCCEFYGANFNFILAEPPFSELGKQLQVWHYRIFCNERWAPIIPRKEVYSSDYTESRWLSFSELYGHKPETLTTVD